MHKKKSIACDAQNKETKTHMRTNNEYVLNVSKVSEQTNCIVQNTAKRKTNIKDFIFVKAKKRKIRVLGDLSRSCIAYIT